MRLLRDRWEGKAGWEKAQEHKNTGGKWSTGNTGEQKEGQENRQRQEVEIKT